MKKIMIAASAAMTLAACSGSASDSALTPGKWKVSAGAKSVDVPGAFDEQKAMFEGMVGKMQSQEQCLTQAEADLGLEPLTEAFGQTGDCEVKSFDASAGAVSGEISCKVPGQETPVGIVISGEYGDGSFAMQVDTEIQQPQLPTGKMNVTIAVEGERIGDC